MELNELTRERALEEHRKMWTWISEKTLEKKKKVKKSEYFEEIFGKSWIIKFNCWCCEYSARNNCLDLKDHCKFCPIKWADGARSCLYEESPFFDWELCKDYEKAARLALVIANLPEKECKLK